METSAIMQLEKSNSGITKIESFENHVQLVLAGLKRGLRKRAEESLRETKSLHNKTKQTFSYMHGALAEFKSSTVFTSAKMDDFDKVLKQVSKETRENKKLCGLLQKENIELARKLVYLEEELVDMQEFRRTVSAGVEDLHCGADEDILAILDRLAAVIQTPLNTATVSLARRYSAGVIMNAVILRFSSPAVQKQWVSAYRRQSDCRRTLPRASTTLSAHIKRVYFSTRPSKGANGTVCLNCD